MDVLLACAIDFYNFRHLTQRYVKDKHSRPKFLRQNDIFRHVKKLDKLSFNANYFKIGFEFFVA